MAGKENKVQSAIQGSLQVYCQNRSLQLFAPYANQQGDDLRKYCGDLLGLMDGADLIALEVKELDVGKGELKEFNEVQHRAAESFAQLGVPLAYAYNAIHIDEIPYWVKPQPRDWARETLHSINRSAPSPLPGQKPNVTGHQTLLDWLDGTHSANGYEIFGQIHGAISAVSDLRNGMLVLLYSVSRNKLASLSADEVELVVRTLAKNPYLEAAKREKLKAIVEASDDLFKMFARKPPTPVAARQDPASSNESSSDDDGSSSPNSRFQP